ncbi:MAG: Tat pathway signal protein [Gemmatimonadales bacterium]
MNPGAWLTRRRFLHLGAVGVPLAGAYLLSEYAPWLDHDALALQLRRPLDGAARGAALLREMVRYASLAANGHNAQAWRFVVTEQGIDIHPDYGRRLQVVDPEDRELWISLGCALENLLLAGRASGYEADVDYPDRQDLIRIRFTRASPSVSRLFEAIPVRQNNRSRYDGTPVPNAVLDDLQALATEPDVTLRLLTGRSGLETIAEYVRLGTLSQYGDAAYVAELTHWLRFTEKEACASRDGLFTRLSGNPEVPRWLGRLFVARSAPETRADLDVGLVLSAPHALVIASETDQRSNWVRAGQVYQRIALAMASCGVHSALHNQPAELSPLRQEFSSALGLGASRPQLVLRLGFGPPLPLSLRRPVEDVLISSVADTP